MARMKQKGPKFDFNWIKDLTPANQLRFIESVGVERFVELVGPKKMIEVMGVDWLLSNLPATELKKLKERLK